MIKIWSEDKIWSGLLKKVKEKQIKKICKVEGKEVKIGGKNFCDRYV